MTSMIVRIAFPALLLVVTTPAMAQPGRLGGGGAVDVSLARIAIALLLGIFLAVFAALWIKRSGGRVDAATLRKVFAKLPIERRIQVVESRRVSQHADLCLVRCDDTEYLILCSAEQQQVLRETPISPPAGSQAGAER